MNRACRPDIFWRREGGRPALSRAVVSFWAPDYSRFFLMIGPSFARSLPPKFTVVFDAYSSFASLAIVNNDGAFERFRRCAPSYAMRCLEAREIVRCSVGASWRKGCHGAATLPSCRGVRSFGGPGTTGCPANTSKMKHPGHRRASRCKAPGVTLRCRLRGSGGFCRKSVTQDPCV